MENKIILVSFHLHRSKAASDVSWVGSEQNIRWNRYKNRKFLKRAARSKWNVYFFIFDFDIIIMIINVNYHNTL